MFTDQKYAYMYILLLCTMSKDGLKRGGLQGGEVVHGHVLALRWGCTD